jgi:putative radical SAM enzyme (TIGR03279 family)
MKDISLRGLKIAGVEPGGIASEVGMEAGDEIISVNSSPVPDYLAYRYLIASEEVTLLIKKKSGGIAEIEIEKDEDDDLGIIAPPMRVRACNNHCVFCFVEQMPRGLRRSLYLKDEDYRHSFLYGNYVTLTTMKDEDYARIIRERLSPLYVSVHATDDKLRRFLLGNCKAPSILEGIKKLTDSGIVLHTQAVVAPGINDGAALIKTTEDLAAFYPKVQSLAVVPVGLTKHRDKLYPLRTFTKNESVRLLEGLEPLRKKYRRKFGVSFVYPSDEFYIKSGRDFPPVKEYDGYPQIDNGVGLVRDFLDEFKKAMKTLTPTFSLRKEKVAKRNGTENLILITGKSFAPILKEIAKEVEGKIKNLKLRVLPVKNSLFGDKVTVAGLLSGNDIIAALKGKKADAAIIPSVTMRDGAGVFLDDLTPEDVERKTGLKIVMAEPTARGLLEVV